MDVVISLLDKWWAYSAAVAALLPKLIIKKRLGLQDIKELINKL